MSAIPAELESALHLSGARIYHTTAQGTDQWSTSCPRCGGKDRFVIRAIREYPHWLAMCRHCSPDWTWIDNLAPTLRRPLTDAEKQEYARRRAEAEAERQRSLQRRLQEYTTGELWRELHRRMSEDNREWWRRRGVPDDWQDYLQLGYTPEKVYKFDGATHVSPAYTIPYLRGDTSITTQYRLTDPADPSDKYRFEAGLPAAYYTTTPTEPLTDQVVICEGAIKAMCVKVRGGLRDDATVLAVPAKKSWAGIVEQVKDCGRVWVILDPDGQREAQQLAAEIGRAARVVTLAGKVDDLIMANDLTADELKEYFRQSSKVY